MSEIRLPQFFSLESSNGEEPFPISISWSLADGQLKSTLIMPEDDWQPWDNNQSEHDTDFLFEQGASCTEILRELIDDIEQHQLYAFDAETDVNLLEMVLSAAGTELEYEIAPFQDAFYSSDSETLWQTLHSLCTDLGSDLSDCESRVRALVFLADSLGAVE